MAGGAGRAERYDRPRLSRVSGHRGQERLVEAPGRMHARVSPPGEQAVDPGFLAAVGVEPDDSVGIGVSEQVGSGAAGDLCEGERTLGREKRIRPCEQAPEPAIAP